MRRREFITVIGGAAVWPVTAHAQQPSKVPTVGFLASGTAASHGRWVATFAQRLSELGWVESRTITINARWAEGRSERAAEIATDFVRQKVDVIITTGTPTTLAAKQATAIIPIVFVAAGDPVADNLIASLARPGGNITGLSFESTDLAGKRVELLRAVMPGLRRLAILVNARNPTAMKEAGEVHAVAGTLGIEVIMLEIRQARDIGLVFEAHKGQADALYVQGDLLTTANRIAIDTQALGARLPSTYAFREDVESGGLMSYGARLPDLFRRAADYVDKILRGAKPAEIPVEQPTKFELVINMKAAKALGLTIPPSLLATADEVIE
jgi:putative ABC transport system substrate-binding protein